MVFFYQPWVTCQVNWAAALCLLWLLRHVTDLWGSSAAQARERARDLYPTLQSINSLTRLMGSSCLAKGGQNTQSCVCCRVPMVTYCIPVLLSKTSGIMRFCVGAQSCKFHWKSKRFCSGNTPLGHLDAQASKSLVKIMLAGCPSMCPVWGVSTRYGIDNA